MTCFGYMRPTDAALEIQLSALAPYTIDTHNMYQETGRVARRRLDDLLEHCRKGDEIVVPKLSHFGLNTDEVLRTVVTLHAKDVRIIIAGHPVHLDPKSFFLAWQIGEDIQVERRNLGTERAKQCGAGPGRKSAIRDEDIIQAKKRFGTQGGANHVGLSKAQFLKRHNQATGKK